VIIFMLKGLLRDRHRSLFPFIVVTLGVALAVLIYCFMHGMVDDTIRSNARIETGHVKIMTRAYNSMASQAPNDFAVWGASEFIDMLEREYPAMDWTPRIKFGGLLDVPDENRETRAQGPAIGLAVDLLGEGSTEAGRLKLASALRRGRLPEGPGEILISDEFARRLGAGPGETATLISSTSNGAMAVQSFKLAGTIRFGIGPLDRNTVIADLADIQYALDMEDGAAEILGFFPSMVYDFTAADSLAAGFNRRYREEDGNLVPVMLTLTDQRGLGEYLDVVGAWVSLIVVVFFFVMSVVLWNTGLMSGIRRYGEIGVRLAIGQSKAAVYVNLIAEALLVGIAGSIAGTCIGLAVSYYLQEVGLDISSMTKGSSVIMANVVRARVTNTSYYIGFIPGLLATLAGTMVSGISIFRRRTAQLFKELEA
jgi:putative ABC transport system permease protein